jgi:hypothetical protein
MMRARHALRRFPFALDADEQRLQNTSSEEANHGNDDTVPGKVKYCRMIYSFTDAYGKDTTAAANGIGSDRADSIDVSLSSQRR